MEPSLHWPARVHHLYEARDRFGDLPDRLLPFLARRDPLADAVVADFADLPPGRGSRLLERALREGLAAVPDAPESLVVLLDHVTKVPVWVDWDRIDRGGTLLFRAGLPGGIVLGAKSLVYGYCAPAGNKPLVMSGRLRGDVGRRLAETSRYVVATCDSGGLRQNLPAGGAGDGVVIALQVRLMHAQVRRLLDQSGTWRSDLWGEPINQHDMLATGLLFSVVFLEGIRQFGVRVTQREADDFVHLWRYASWLMGVDPELLPASEAEGRRLGEAIFLTQGPPDADSRALVRALVESPLEAARTLPQRRRVERQVALGWGFVRVLLGDELADQLGAPRDGYRFVLPLVRRVVDRMERVRHLIPGGDRLAIQAGRRYWRDAIDAGLRGQPARFPLPLRLGGLTPTRTAA